MSRRCGDLKNRATAEREADKKTGSCQWLMAQDTAGFTAALKTTIGVGPQRGEISNIFRHQRLEKK